MKNKREKKRRRIRNDKDGKEENVVEKEKETSRGVGETRGGRERSMLNGAGGEEEGKEARLTEQEVQGEAGLAGRCHIRTRQRAGPPTVLLLHGSQFLPARGHYWAS